MEREFDNFEELVREHGDQVLIHTVTCVEFKLNHATCKGCISELGCAKAVAMLGVSLTPMMYQPKDYTDYEKMQHSIEDKLDRILNAKTSDEIKQVRW